MKYWVENGMVFSLKSQKGSFKWDAGCSPSFLVKLSRAIELNWYMADRNQGFE